MHDNRPPKPSVKRKTIRWRFAMVALERIYAVKSNHEARHSSMSHLPERNFSLSRIRMEFVRPNNKHCGAIRRRFTIKTRQRTDALVRASPRGRHRLVRCSLMLLRSVLIRSAGWRSGRARIWRTIFVVTGEHPECRRAVVEEQHQLPPLDLSDFPAIDIVADPHTQNFRRWACSHNRASFFAIHGYAEQRHIGWRRRRWRRGHDDRGWRRRPAGW
jgi:hypothetical protein